MYELLTGEPPHAGKTAMEVITKKATEEPIPARRIDPDIPEPLEQVVMRCLDRDPDARPQTMGQLEYELTKSMKGRGTAVAAVLGLKTASGARLGVEPARQPVGEPGLTGSSGVSAGFNIPSSGRNMGTSPTIERITTPPPPVAPAAEPIDPSHEAAMAMEALELDRPTTHPDATTMAPPSDSPSTLQRVVGIFAGLAFLGIAAFAAYHLLPLLTPGHGDPTHETPTTISTGPDGRPLLTNSPDVTNPPPENVPQNENAQNPPPVAVPPTTNTVNTAPVTTTTTPAENPSAAPVAVPVTVPVTVPAGHKSNVDVAQLLEWARRTVEGNRLIAPPGDNLKELLGRIAEADPRNREAEELRQKAVAQSNHRAALALHKSKLDDAIDGYEAARVLAPEQDDNRHALARALRMRAALRLEQRKPKGAEADATASLTLEPADLSTHAVLADIFLAVGKPDLAAVEYQRMLDLAPNDKRARKGLYRANLAKAPPKGKRNKRR